MDYKKRLVVNGRKAVSELIQNRALNHLILEVYLSNTQKFLIKQCESNNVKYSIKSRSSLNMIHEELNSKYNDVFAILRSKNQINFVELKKELIESSQSEFIVMIDKVHDPYNFGAIIRTCVGAGVKYLIYSAKNNVRLNNSVLKTSQGYALHLDLISVSNLSYALSQLKELGFWSYAATLSSPSEIYYRVKFEPRSILVLGNEGDGISKKLEEEIDFKLRIPLSPGINSLNVSAAAAILIYEAARQNRILNP